MTDEQRLHDLLEELGRNLTPMVSVDQELAPLMAELTRLLRQPLDDDILTTIADTLNAIARRLDSVAFHATGPAKILATTLAQQCNNTAIALATKTLDNTAPIYERLGRELGTRTNKLSQANAQLSNIASGISTTVKVLNVIEALLKIITYALTL